MSTNQIALPDSRAEQRNQQIRSDLRSLGRHDWSLWGLALMVILSMTATLIAVLSSLSDSGDSFFQLNMSQSIRGLVGVVLIFSVYTFYQQLQLKQTRLRLATQIEVATRQQERVEEVLASATPDSVTGLYNECFGEVRLASEIARAQRNGGSLTVLMLGLDDFEQISDRYGPAAGDSALRTFAAGLNKAIRGCDLAVLAGRGDIMLVLPECSVEQAQSVVNRLPAVKIEVDGKIIPLTVTGSSTSYKPDETSEELSLRARQALDTKRQSRPNQQSSII